MQPTEPTLIYEDTGELVAVGDLIRLDRGRGEYMTVVSFRPPHKPASSGKCIIRAYNGYNQPAGPEQEVYVGVIGAKWINRTDRKEQ